MIKVGDKIIIDNLEHEVYGVFDYCLEVVTPDGFIGQVSLLDVVEQQKQRADELEHKLNKEIDESERQLRRWYEELKRADRAEKRWSELRQRMEHDEKEAFGEGDVIAYTVHNYVLELMHDLEEDGE